MGPASWTDLCPYRVDIIKLNISNRKSYICMTFKKDVSILLNMWYHLYKLIDD